ncbi:uncharacterized protein ColSpa_11967 [Colletotrichum spaethianum]|uniref:Prion-inhibition and propagation HeLo domain-containing protein n=1 Tax=Colletotrichum spaethianum TaxID=700344 RepID=A0AA37PGB6_9PEZI|nr:uncharacterized protein ColSpa_11967 [Colletotrichum spaethianum]GKT51786.1 hypothetical protein ColSpa_11967 [Colletotrichum spaethianum]
MPYRRLPEWSGASDGCAGKDSDMVEMTAVHVKTQTPPSINRDNLTRATMEPVGLAVGIVGLAGLFSSCLEAVEKFDSYKNFGRDSRSLATLFDTDKHRFEQ